MADVKTSRQRLWFRRRTENHLDRIPRFTFNPNGNHHSSRQHRQPNDREKLNAQFEIIARNRFIFHGKPTDGMVWSLIPSDIGYEPPEPVPPTNTDSTEQNKTANTESVAPEAETKPNDANQTS